MRCFGGRIKDINLGFGKIVLIALILGLAVRLILIPFTSSPFDVAAGWAAVIEEIYAGNSLYDAEMYKYTPVWGYVLSVLAYVADLIGMDSFGEMFTTIYPGKELTYGYGFITNPAFNTLVKAPALIFDILAAFAFYRLAMDITNDRRKAEISFALWFLCPVVIMSSAILCMFDSIVVFFAVEALILLRRKEMLLAGIFIALSILTKAFFAILLPLVIVYLLSDPDLGLNARLKNLAKSAAGAVAVFLLVYAAPLLCGEFSDSMWFLTSRSEGYSSSGVINLTSLGFNNVFFYVPVILLLILISCIVMARSRRDRDKTLLILVAMTSSLLFCFPFVSYTPTYGVMLLLPVILLYCIWGRIAMIPWVLLLFFVFHWAAHYWETSFYPLAAFTDLISMSDIVEEMGNGTLYYAILLFMSSSGFAIMMIIQRLYAIPELKRYRRGSSEAEL